MTHRTRLCLALVVLAAVGSVVAVPLTTINAGDAPANESGNTKSEALAKFQKEETDPTTTGTELSPQQQPNTPGNESTGSEFPAVVTDSKPQTPKTDQSDVTANVEASTESNLPATTAEPNRLSSPQGQNSKPYFTGNVQTVNMGSGLPFFMELLQPIHPFPGQYNQQPSRYQQPPPFAAPVDPFYPFTSPVALPSFNQLFSDYTNEFRKMLESLDKSMMHNIETVKDSQVKPVGKTTTRTEIINGHVVQINETTYTDGDSNHNSFYHFKEIHVLPEKPNKKISTSEEVISSVNNDSQTKNEDTDDASNEIKRESPEIVTPIAETTSNNNNNKLNKKVD